jgi:hypothetical protein
MYKFIRPIYIAYATISGGVTGSLNYKANKKTPISFITGFISGPILLPYTIILLSNIIGP